LINVIVAWAVVMGLVALSIWIGRSPERSRPGAMRVRPGVTLEGTNVSGLTFTEVRDIARRQKGYRDRRPQNATIDKKSGGVVPEKLGLIVDPEATARRAVGAREGQAINLAIRRGAPRWKTCDLTGLAAIGSYRTAMQGTQPRQDNIQLAAGFIDRTVLYPGQEFSFNRLVGPYTRARGYQDAPTFDRGKVVPGIGGGCCQVSSTLYNAVLGAGMRVMERHAHSRPVTYVPRGSDATVDVSKDFRFINNRSRPVVVRTYINDGELIAELLGKGD